jgi:flavin-dependent dehydrogenase
LSPIDIVGAGPAGSAAAIAACELGCPVRLFEKSAFPRHKVCGEFLSPGVRPVFEQLGVLAEVERLRPARITRVNLHFAHGQKNWTLAEEALGLSRYSLDNILYQRALSAGAVPMKELWTAPGAPERRLILAHGRLTTGRRGSRLFGFKAHFRGPVSDAVELFFPSGGYAGVCCVEDGITNVCGIASERLLRKINFDFDELLRRWPLLAERIRPLERCWDWLSTGPLVFGNHFDAATSSYLAGDALGFIDPFTGSGILGGMVTGRMAGMAAAQNLPVRDHVRMCRQALGRQFATAGLFRSVVRAGLADWLARFVPGRLLFYLTRPGGGIAA